MMAVIHLVFEKGNSTFCVSNDVNNRVILWMKKIHRIAAKI